MEAMAVEEVFLTDMVEHYGYTVEEAQDLWEEFKDTLYDALWDELSHVVNQKIPHKEI